MATELISKEEQEDLKKRQQLQAKFQEIVRRSGSSSEMHKIQMEIEALNRKLESYGNRARKA